MEIETQSYITNLLKTNPKIVENNLNYNDKKFNKKKEYYQLKEHIDTIYSINFNTVVQFTKLFKKSQ